MQTLQFINPVMTDETSLMRINLLIIKKLDIFENKKLIAHMENISVGASVELLLCFLPVLFPRHRMFACFCCVHNEHVNFQVEYYVQVVSRINQKHPFLKNLQND